MKRYLDLVPIFAKAHRRQNRMTILCIVFAVFLVTGIFSMAEMGIRMETGRLSEKHGAEALLSLAKSAAVQNYYLIAGVLFLLILLSGVLMISGSIGSNVSERTRFFGMLRCIGMSKRQIVRFVRLEALSWCKLAIPTGVVLGTVCTWILCAVLRFFVGEEFTRIPLFGVSIIGVLSGALVGVVTVLLAAGAPARRAAKASPVAAVSGNSESAARVAHAANTRLFKIDAALGVHHATAQTKNLFLVAGSFALSILLFLCFSVLIDLVDCMMPQSAAAADLSIAASDGENAVDSALPSKLADMGGVLRAFGRRNLLGVPATVEKGAYRADTVDLVSFGAFDLDCLKKDGLIKRGGDVKRVYGDSASALLIADPDAPFAAGDQCAVMGETLTVAGILKYNPFSADGGSDGTVTLIVSDETFRRLTGIAGYSLVLVQTARDATDADIEAIRRSLDANCVLDDQRGLRTDNTYRAFVLCVYGFLTVLALITALHIVNSIAMSVNARIRQYGAMRAVGMEERQVVRMIVAEAATYAVSGCLLGCAVGLPVSKWLYGFLITSHFPYARWQFPAASLLLVLLITFAAAFAAVMSPVKRIRRMSVTETINEL